MKLACISDTHGFHRTPKLESGDVLIHAGDATMLGEIGVIKDLVMYFNELRNDGKFKEIIFVPGNHDLCFDIRHARFNERAREMMEASGIHYLVDRAVTIEGVKFYGSPWVPNLPRWAFYDRDQDQWAEAPTDIDVLITHGPAFGLLDRLMSGEHVGSMDLLKYVVRCPNLRYHFHGHIHEDRGSADVYPGVLGGPAYTLVNAAICDRHYEPNGQPWECEITK